MAIEGSARLVQAEVSRTVIYLSQAVVRDSQFPFKPRDALRARIDVRGKRLIIELDPEANPKAQPRKASRSP